MKTNDDDDNDDNNDDDDNGLAVDAIVSAVVGDDCETYEHYVYDGIGNSDACHKTRRQK